MHHPQLHVLKKLYHICGYIFKTHIIYYKRMAKSTGKPKYGARMQCIFNRFLESGDEHVNFKDLSEWTKAQDRGGLLYVSQDAFTFFENAEAIIRKSGKSTSTVSQIYDKAVDEILSSATLLRIWGRLTSDLTSEHESLDFLDSMIRSYKCERSRSRQTDRTRNQFYQSCCEGGQCSEAEAEQVKMVALQNPVIYIF